MDGGKRTTKLLCHSCDSSAPRLNTLNKSFPWIPPIKDRLWSLPRAMSESNEAIHISSPVALALTRFFKRLT